MRRSWRVISVIALTAAIIWVVGDVREIGRVLAKVNLGFIVLGFSVITVDRLLMSYKWGLLLPRNSSLGLARNCQIYCTSMMWGLLLPMTLGADAIRTVLVSRLGIDAHVLVASIVVERMIGFIASLIFGLASLLILRLGGFIGDRFDAIFLVALICLLVGIVLIMLSFSERTFRFLSSCLPDIVRTSRIGGVLNKFHQTYSQYGGKYGLLGAFFALTLVEQFLTIVFAWVVAVGCHLNVSFIFMAGVIPLAILISRLPISFDGIGVIEVSLIALLSLAGVGPAESVAFAIAARVVQILAWSPWWLSYTFQGNNSRPAGEKVQDKTDGASVR
jgi:glycosyltransferase 2 family protein